MKGKFIVVTILTLILISMFTAVQASPNWYVAAGGNDANDCTTLATACATIQAAITKASSGHIISVAAGTYTEQIDLNKQVSIWGANYNIPAGANPGTRVAETIIYGGFIVSASGAEIDGVTIQDGRSSGSVKVGVAVATSNVTVKNTIIEDVLAPAQSDGISTQLGNNNLTLTNSTIRNNWRGIYLNPGDGHTLTGNLIDANNGVGVGIGSDGQSNLTLTGNTISNHTLEGWGASAVGTNVVATGNTFTNNGVSIAHYGGAQISAASNYWGTVSPSGVAASVSGDVDYEPWCNSDFSSCTFTLPVHNVTQNTAHPTIQTAVDAADPGDEIQVDAGVYSESVHIWQTVTLKGPNAGELGYGARGAEAVVEAQEWYGIYVNADGVIIDGIKVTGDATTYNVAIYEAENVTVQNSVISGTLLGIIMYAYDLADRNGGLIIDNYVTGAAHTGIHVRGNMYAQIESNHIDDSNLGITTEWFTRGKPVSAPTPAITDNVIAAKRIGIRYNQHYDQHSMVTPFTVAGNTITALPHTSSPPPPWTGIEMVTLNSDFNLTIGANTIDGSAAGSRITSGFEAKYITGPNIAISGGTVSNVNYGIWASDGMMFTGRIDDLHVSNVVFNDIAEAAFLIEDIDGSVEDAPGGVADGVHVTIGANTYNNVPVELLLAGPDVEVSFDGISGFNTVGVLAAGPGFYDAEVFNVPVDYRHQRLAASINYGISRALPDGTVYVGEGTYVEQVVIEKALTLQGMDANKPVIQAPPFASRDTYTIAETTRTFNPILFIDGGAGLIEVTIDGFEIDGQNDPGAGNFIGVLARNVAPGLIANNDLHSLMDGQETLGISVYGSASEVTVSGNTVTDFSRNGITIVEAAQAVVADNVVVGRSYVGTGFWAQNGIQFYQVASGSVSGNTLSEIGWIWPGTGTAWTSTGILIWENDGTTLVEDNNLTNVQVGIRFSSSSFEAVGNTVLMLDSDGLANSGGIWGNPQGRPNVAASPFDIPNDPTALMSSGTLSFLYENNIVIGDGAANSWGVSIWPYTGFDVDAFATGNTVQDWFIGFDIWGGDVFTATINENQIVGNNYGLYNWTTTEVDATLNWWGTLCDPGSTIVGPADYSPWWGDETGSFLVDATATGLVVPNGATTAEANAIFACAPPYGTVDFEDNGVFDGGIVVTTPGLTIKLNGATVGPGSPAFTIEAPNITITQGDVPGGVLDGDPLGTGNSTSPAVLVNAGGNNFTLKDVEVRNWADGVEVADDVISFKLFDNWIHSNTGAGLQINSDVTLGGVVSIQGNLFKVNGGNGIQHDGIGTLPAVYNSWGHVDGPASGDGVTANVDADPWTFAEVYMDVDPTTAGDQYVRAVNEGDTFTVTLMVDAANLYGISFRFTFTDTLLTLNEPPTFSPPWDTAFCREYNDLLANEIGYQCALIDPALEWDGGTVATFNFTANGSGLIGDGPWAALFDISHEVADTSAGAIGGAKVFVNNAGFNDPSDPARDITDNNDGQIDITGLGNFTGFVNLQGRSDDSGAIIEVFDVANKDSSVLLAQGTSAAGGAFTTAFVGSEQLYVGGTYYFQINRPLFLPTTIVATTTSPMPGLPDDWAHSAPLLFRPLTSLNNVLLLGGDATNSNFISIGDASCIGSNYGSTVPLTCGGVGTPDVNEDGIVNILDLTLMGGNYEKNSSPWSPWVP